MNCKHCAQPVRRCAETKADQCRGWVHTRDGLHVCDTPNGTSAAQPEPGAPPLTEAPSAPPAREVAMTRDDLEAVVWRALTRPDTRTQVQRVNDVLRAADAYARTTGGITAERRAQLGATGRRAS